MSTYAESLSQPSPDWLSLLIQASRGCKESENQVQNHYDLAISGPMGSLDKDLERDSYGEITSPVLIGMYDELMGYIQAETYERAYTCMKEILDIQEAILQDEYDAANEEEEKEEERPHWSYYREPVVMW